MPVTIPNPDITTAGTALASAIHISWPLVSTDVPSGESADDIAQAMNLLRELQYNSDAYDKQAGSHNATEAAAIAAAAAYSAAVTSYTASLHSAWTALDGSVRSAEQELINVGDSSHAWAPGTATTPQFDVPAMVSRVGIAVTAVKTHSSLLPIAPALQSASDALSYSSQHPPVAQFVFVLPAPDMNWIPAAVAKVDNYVTYLAGSP